MKFELALTLLGLATVQVAAHPAASPEADPQLLGGLRGSGSGGGAAVGPPKMIPPKYRSTAKRAILRYPAFTLAPNGQGRGMSMDPNGQAGTLRIGGGMCSPCTILSARYRLVYPDGREATTKDGVYIHHMTSNLSPKTSSNPISGGSASFSLGSSAYFIDRGEDSGETDTVFTSQDGTFASGYQVTRPPSISVQYDLVNYEKTAKQLHLELEYEWVDGIVGKDAGHTLKSVSGAPKVSPTGPATSQSGRMSITRDTTIMWARGHLHAGGDRMEMYVNGKLVCTSRPTYNAQNVITTMSLCPEPIALKKGDTMQIQSVYDLTKHPLRESSDGSGHAAHGVLGGSDVMGMFAMSYTT